MPSVFEDDVTPLVTKLAEALGALPKKTAETMAKTAFKVLKEAAAAEGQTPGIEVAIWKPGEKRYFDDTTCWTVAWEAGPYEWAIPASMAIGSTTGKLVEPYYSFDLCFYPSEDKE